jgi:Transposase DDE domain
MMAIVISYHHPGFKCFKYYYRQVIQKLLGPYFPRTYAYPRFVHLMERLNLPLFVFPSATRPAPSTGGDYVGATRLVVSHNQRIFPHKAFKGVAGRGKSSTGWFFGLKRHAVINENGQLAVFRATPGNVAGNDENLSGQPTRHLQGFLYGDAGYISPLSEKLRERGLALITKLRKNMKRATVLNEEQKYCPGHRGLIGSVFNLMKNHCDIEHGRHGWTPPVSSRCGFFFQDT